MSLTSDPFLSEENLQVLIDFTLRGWIRRSRSGHPRVTVTLLHHLILVHAPPGHDLGLSSVLAHRHCGIGGLTELC